MWLMRMHVGPMAKLTSYDGVVEFVRPFGAADRAHVGRITTYATRRMLSAHGRASWRVLKVTAINSDRGLSTGKSPNFRT